MKDAQTIQNEHAIKRDNITASTLSWDISSVFWRDGPPFVPNGS